MLVLHDLDTQIMATDDIYVKCNVHVHVRGLIYVLHIVRGYIRGLIICIIYCLRIQLCALYVAYEL